jgi:hypothetical protein
MFEREWGELRMGEAKDRGIRHDQTRFWTAAAQPSSEFQKKSRSFARPHKAREALHSPNSLNSPDSRSKFLSR